MIDEGKRGRDVDGGARLLGGEHVFGVGCARPCAHEQNPQSSGFPECRAADGTFPNNAEACALIDGCSWDPACFENPALTCDSDLPEAECRRRSGKWEQVSSGNTL